jgi:hypothetical protein
MSDYKYIDVSENQLEDLIRNYSTKIEDGLIYLDHQKITDRGPLDVLFVDSGRALVVAELKIIEEDQMLTQGIDYYDFITRNIDSIARQYKNISIDTKQKIRLLLIAPTFSVNLINRCKWIDIPLSLFLYKCIVIENSKETIPIFSEINIPSLPETIEVYNIEDRINYVIDKNMKKLLEDLINEIKGWNNKNILIDAIKYNISLKIHGTVFAYLRPRRDFFIVSTYNQENKWTDYRVEQKQDLEDIRRLLNINIEKYN